MKWEYCENCYIDGHCENQDRGYECENYGKRIKDKCERLQKQLDIAVNALEKYATKEEYIIAQSEYTSTIEYKAFNDGGITAQKALDDIKELNK